MNDEADRPDDDEDDVDRAPPWVDPSTCLCCGRRGCGCTYGEPLGPMPD